MLLVAGGIGVTPFLSILRQASRDGGPRRLCLVYSNRRREEAAYLDELEQLAETVPGFRLVSVMTREPLTRGAGPQGHVNATVLGAARAGLHRPLCLIAGPPAMVSSVRDGLVASGVAEDDVRDEVFFGY